MRRTKSELELKIDYLNEVLDNTFGPGYNEAKTPLHAFSNLIFSRFIPQKPQCEGSKLTVHESRDWYFTGAYLKLPVTLANKNELRDIAFNVWRNGKLVDVYNKVSSPSHRIELLNIDIDWTFNHDALSLKYPRRGEDVPVVIVIAKDEINDLSVVKWATFACSRMVAAGMLCFEDNSTGFINIWNFRNARYLPFAKDNIHFLDAYNTALDNSIDGRVFTKPEHERREILEQMAKRYVTTAHNHHLSNFGKFIVSLKDTLQTHHETVSNMMIQTLTPKGFNDWNHFNETTQPKRTFESNVHAMKVKVKYWDKFIPKRSYTYVSQVSFALSLLDPKDLRASFWNTYNCSNQLDPHYKVDILQHVWLTDNFRYQKLRFLKSWFVKKDLEVTEYLIRFDLDQFENLGPTYVVYHVYFCEREILYTRVTYFFKAQDLSHCIMWGNYDLTCSNPIPLFNDERTDYNLKMIHFGRDLEMQVILEDWWAHHD